MNHAHMTTQINIEIKAILALDSTAEQEQYRARLHRLESFLDTLKHNPLQILSPEKMARLIAEFDELMSPKVHPLTSEADLKTAVHHDQKAAV